MRKIFISLLVSVAGMSVPAIRQAAPKRSHQATSEQQVLVILNVIRAQHGLSAFTASTPLRNAARSHSADMIQNSYFDHDSPSEAWYVRVARYLKSSLIGEDIAWGTGSYGTPEGIVSQWMHSAPHRHIILTADMHRVGLGISTGTFGGTPGAVMATADFSA
ncbi:MAG TPA: CAP domain-containing protein [Gaiellales bacterium]|jgi:uncharacterized protein YkwD|nr:CAP domain-containing protein [Gaiellales bacterium]